MSTIIKQFTNRKKQKVAGKTPEHAVYDENGVRLDYKLKSLTNSIKTIVIEYLKEHPEMIVALQDGSVTKAKLAEDVYSWLVDLGDRIKEESSNARQNEQELYDKFRSIEKTLDNITKTGEASAASNVILQSISGLIATNVQDAISEIVNDASKIKTNTESLEGNNIQENLNAAGRKLNELENIVGDHTYEKSVRDSVSNVYVDFNGSQKLIIDSNMIISVLEATDNINGEGWRIQYRINGADYYFTPKKDSTVLSPESKVEYILVWHKANTGSGTIKFNIKNNLSVESFFNKQNLITKINHEGMFNVNALAGGDTKVYTLSEAINAIPENIRYIAKVISYKTQDGVEVAVFNANAFKTDFTNTDNWNIVSKYKESIGFQDKHSIYVSDNILTSANAELGAGWSGNLQNGYIHSKGNEGLLTLRTGLGWGRYVAKITRINGTLALDDGLCLKIGNLPYLDVYNGTDEMYAYFGGEGAVDASTIILKPRKEIDFSIKIELFYISTPQSAKKVISINKNSISHGQCKWNNTGFWNIVLGNYALSKSQNATRNIVLGNAALAELVGGTRNISIGTFSSSLLFSGDRNISIGADSLYTIKEASDTIAIGKAAFGAEQVSGNLKTKRSVAIGTDTFKGQRPQTEISDSIAIGYSAGYKAGSNNICIGTNADMPSQDVENSIVIGNNREALGDNEVWVGNKNTKTIVLGNRKLTFNEDGTVTWEYSKTRNTYSGSVLASESYNQYLSFDGADSISIGKPFRFIVTSISESIQDANGWRLEVHLQNGNVIYEPLNSNYDKTFESQCDNIKIWHKSGTGSGNIGFIVETEDNTELVV